jgi:hypothetical protein
MHCGCPLPGDTIGQKLKRLLPSNQTTNELLLPLKSDARAATHPSDHNAVFALHDMTGSLRRREKRQRKAEARRLRDEREGQMVRKDRGVDHGIAFLYPVPMFYYFPGGCFAAGGGVVNGALGCAAVSVVIGFVG